MRSWKVYLIYNATHNRTYVGATTDVSRRLRQHRGELIGGAKSTTKLGPDWKLLGYLDGFTSQSEAYRWEKIIKSRCRGYSARVLGFIQVSLGKCPASKTGRQSYPVPSGLNLMTELKNLQENSDIVSGGRETSP